MRKGNVINFLWILLGVGITVIGIFEVFRRYRLYMLNLESLAISIFIILIGIVMVLLGINFCKDNNKKE